MLHRDGVSRNGMLQSCTERDGGGGSLQYKVAAAVPFTSVSCILCTNLAFKATRTHGVHISRNLSVHMLVTWRTDSDLLLLSA